MKKDIKVLKRHIAICVPSLGTVSARWALSFAFLRTPLNTGALHFMTLRHPVAEGRNRLVKMVLDTEKESSDDFWISHIFWLDDDVLPHRGAIIQLLSRKKPIVSGVYFCKADPPDPLIFESRLGGPGEFEPDGFRQVWGHGMGLTLVETDVYKRMLKEGDLGEDEFGCPRWYHSRKDADAIYTEDLYFLAKADEMGIPAFIDQTPAAFGWHVGKDVINDVYPKKQWKEFMETQKITWDTPNGPVVWEGVQP